MHLSIENLFKGCGLTFLIVLMFLDPTASVNIPINAVILNSPPKLLGAAVDQQVDPCTPFNLNVTVSDNNTLRDISTIELVFEPRGHPPTFILNWSRDQEIRLLGEAFHVLGIEKPDVKKAEGSWGFSLQFPSSSAYGPWTVRVLVADEQNSSQCTLSFWVNSYISVRLASHTPIGLMLASKPGSVARTVIDLAYTANEPVDLLASCTSFEGVSDPSYFIPANAFYLTLGQREILLSKTDASVVSGLPPSENRTVRLILQTDIPSPFLDQEYKGTVSFTLRPTQTAS